MWFLRATQICCSAYATAIPSVCLSVTRMLCIKTAELLSPSDSSIVLVFRNKGLLRKSDGFTPKYTSRDFRPICGYISETARDRGIFSLPWTTNIKSYVLYRIVPLSTTLTPWLEWPRTRFQCLKANWPSQTVHPIHSMFGSRLGFSGSLGRMSLFPVGLHSNKDGVGKTWYSLALCVNISKTVRDTTKLLLTTNRKLHMRFRLAPRWMTLNGCKFEFSPKFALSNSKRIR